MGKNRLFTFILSLMINGVVFALLWFCEPPLSPTHDNSVEIFLQGSLLLNKAESDDLLAGDLVPFQEFDQQQYQKKADDNKSREIEESVYNMSRSLESIDHKKIQSEIKGDILFFDAEEAKRDTLLDDGPGPLADDIFQRELAAIEQALPLAPELENLPDFASREGKVYQKQEIQWQNEKRKALSNPLPAFPEILYREGKETELDLEISVDKSGRIVDVLILHSSGYPEVDLEVKNRILSWIFEAKDEDSVDSGEVVVYFRLVKPF
ncbi:MAG: TonB family protein [Spirochaetales bacterium]|nr:TonB family protein [Spirochaetales bacterium]